MQTDMETRGLAGMGRATSLIHEISIPSTKFRQSEAKSHLGALDGLRAIAILLVLASHTSDDFPRSVYALAANGWCGVDLFFVLSGFLITRGLLAAKGATNYFKSFYGKRFLRIFPVFYAALAATFLILPRLFSGLPTATTHDKWFYWLYVNNWAGFMDQPQIHLIGHFWSLAVEEQFYIFWPVVVLLTSRRTLAAITVSCVVIAPLLRVALVVHHVNPETIYRNTFCRMDALMAGGLCAIVLADSAFRHRIRAVVPKLPWTGFAILVLVHLYFGYSYFGRPMLTAGLSAYVLAFTMLVLGYAHPEAKTKILDAKPLRYLATWSYGIYVYHLAFVYFAHRYEWGSGMLRVLIEVGASIAFAAISYHFLEYPLLQMKRHFRPIFAAST